MRVTRAGCVLPSPCAQGEGLGMRVVRCNQGSLRHEDHARRDLHGKCRTAQLPVRAAAHRHRADRRRRGDPGMAGADGADARPRVGRGPRAGPRPVRHRSDRRRHDPRPVPGRPHRDDRHQRGRDCPVGHRRQGLRPAGLQAPGRPLPTARSRLRQRLVRRGAHPSRVRRAGTGRGRARLPRAEVRPVRHRLEGSIG